MKRVIFFIFSFLLIFSLLGFASEKKKGVGYVGSEVCKSCHEEIYNLFVESGHPYKLRKAELAKKAGLPLPKGYTWDDISYVIGGKTKKARYIGLDGYIITTDKKGNKMKTQYNLEDGSWAYYHAGEIKPYKCGPCHMTNYSPEGHQDGKPGMIGTWSLDGIQCEECHGPASAHIENPKVAKLTVDKSAKACGKCHIRGSADKIPASKGFIRHHEQYNELLAGAHKDLTCVECHDPHAKAAVSIKTKCADCHDDVASKFAKTVHGKNQVDCISCHMPKAAKSAIKKAKYVGDVRSHLFKINTSANYNMFTKDGKFAKSELSLEFSCLIPGCHAGETKDWAARKAKMIH
ncbi:multiheme c-type cytochrome [Deferribacter thermophilus]|uniref:multiheme c-type cytochrome n=1 Tax=Deferribacter thermophilus TaxID=53573 RepID=UPI003C2906C5